MCEQFPKLLNEALHSQMVTGWTLYLGLCLDKVWLQRRTSKFCLFYSFCLGTLFLYPVWLFILFFLTALVFQAPFTTVFRSHSCLQSSWQLILFFVPHDVYHSTLQPEYDCPFRVLEMGPQVPMLIWFWSWGIKLKLLCLLCFSSSYLDKYDMAMEEKNL